MKYSQTFLKVDPATGAIFYDFEGHIHAQGIDVDTSDVSGIPPAERINFIRQGDYAGFIQSYTPRSTARTLPDRPAGLNFGNEVQVIARTPPWPPNPVNDDSNNAKLIVASREVAFGGGTPQSAVNAVAGAQNKTIINSDGGSDFTLAPVRLGQQSTWASYGTPYPDPLCQIFGGMIAYTGLVKSTTAAAGQLIAYGNGAQNYHPANRQIFPAQASVGGVNRIVRVDIVDDPTWGLALIYQDTPTNVDWLSLGGIIGFL